MLIRALVVLSIVASAAVSQTVLAPGDVGVVTTDGFLRVRSEGAPLPPTHYLAPASMGFAAMPAPGIIWETGTDAFLVCAADRLVRVTLGATTASVTDLTPSLAPGAALVDIDMHPADGRLVLLDAGNAQALFYDPPFAAGMTPSFVLPVHATTKSLVFDPYKYPPSVIYARGGKVERSTLGGTTTPVAELKLCDGIDDNAQSSGGIYITKASTHQIAVSSGNPGFIQNLNIIGLCSPVVLSPRSVAYDPVSTWTAVLAEDGLNPGCYGGYVGGNHVVMFPPAQGVFPPDVLTQPFGSSITGTDGDIALVMGDFAFGSPYGTTCTAPDGTSPRLLNDFTIPVPGNDLYTIKVTQATPGAPVYLWVGFAPDELPLASGCTFLVQPFMSFLAGTTNGNGKLVVPGDVPLGVPLGTELFVQGVVPWAGGLTWTNGLLLHVGLE